MPTKSAVGSAASAAAATTTNKKKNKNGDSVVAATNKKLDVKTGKTTKSTIATKKTNGKESKKPIEKPVAAVAKKATTAKKPSKTISSSKKQPAKSTTTNAKSSKNVSQKISKKPKQPPATKRSKRGKEVEPVAEEDGDEQEEDETSSSGDEMEEDEEDEASAASTSSEGEEQSDEDEDASSIAEETSSEEEEEEDEEETEELDEDDSEAIYASEESNESGGTGEGSEASDEESDDISGSEMEEEADVIEPRKKKISSKSNSKNSKKTAQSKNTSKQEVKRRGRPLGSTKKSKSTKSDSSSDDDDDGLTIGMEVLCKWSGNNEEYPAKILKRRNKDPSSPDNVEYYMRYSGFDHRLDEWVPRDRVREYPPNYVSNGAAIPASAAAPQPGNKRTHSAATLEIRSSSPCSSDEDDSHQVKNIHSIELGRYEIETWYYSPYPEEYCKDAKLYICEFCLKYMKRKHTLERHAEKCELRHPPGVEIYREGELSVFEVDGKKQRIYCQNLCLLSKLFLDHKTLYYDVDPFYFYILTECDDQGAHVVGYFSKEKFSPDGFNLACIMTLPPYQRKGYGSFLISLSYEISKREGVVGSPEKPLSDLGRLGYRSYWSRVILQLLRAHRGDDLSIRDIAKLTSISPDDIVDTLKDLKLVRFWKGKHVLVISQKLIDAYLDSTAGKKFRVADASKLNWAPRHKAGSKSADSRHG
jgi:histone acetyltransferase MYST1